LPFGDNSTVYGELIQKPFFRRIDITDCGIDTEINAAVVDTVIVDQTTGELKSSVNTVKFYYYYDRNNNGIADDGYSWISIGEGTLSDTLNPWTVYWDTTSIFNGQYLIKGIAYDNQGNSMDSYTQYENGESREIAIFNNSCGIEPPSVSGMIFEDYDDKGNHFDSNQDYPKSDVILRLYRETDGVNDFSIDDSYVGSTITDTNGEFLFENILSGTYYIVVDSKSITPHSLNSGYTDKDVWAEQTYVREYTDGAYIESNNFGGKDPSVSDDFNPNSTDISENHYEHIAKVEVNTEDINGIDFGFSFNVIVNENDTGDNSQQQNGNQGTLRQFVLNSNAILGANAARFVMMTAQNSSSDGNSWWTIQPQAALPDITDVNTTIDGTVYTPQGAVINSNSQTFGGGLAGIDNVVVPELNGKEIEIDSFDLQYILKASANAENFTLKNVAFFNGGGNVGDTVAPVIIDSQNSYIESIISGARADGSRPATSTLNRRYGLVINESGMILNSYIAYNGSGLLLAGNAIEVQKVTILDNGIGSSGTDGNGISILSPAASVTIRDSIIDSNGGNHAGVNHGNGIYTDGDILTLLHNLTVVYSTASGISLNNSQGATVRKSIIKSSSNGPGIRVSSDSSFGDFTDNSFGDNRGLAIDLIRSELSSVIEGVNPNDSILNEDYGNKGIDHPVITLARLSGNTLFIVGYVGQNTLSANFAGSVVEIYSASAGDGDSYLGENYGEGIDYLGSLVVDSQGNFEGNITSVSDEMKIVTALTRYESFSASLNTLAYSTSEFGPNKPIVPLKIRGYIYEDLNFNKARDYGEPGIMGVRTELWKFTDGNWTFQSYIQTDNTGFYSFDVSQGTYRVVEDAQNLHYSSNEGSDPVEYISTTPNWVEVIIGNTDMTVNFGDFKGFVVKGYVFEDTGAGFISRANDTKKDPGEVGIPNARVELINGEDTYTRYTDQDGLYRFFVAGDPVYPIILRQTDLPAYVSTGDYDSDGSASIEERNKITINSDVNSSTFYNFADVRRLLLEGINNASGLPGSIVNLDHSLLVSTYGSISLEAISALGFNIVIYEVDIAGNMLDIWDNNEVRSPGRYYLRLVVNIPTDTISGTLDSIKLKAVQNWENSEGSDTAETYDTLTVGTEVLSIKKETRNFTNNGPWGLSSKAKPGEIIEYRISFTNNGNLAIPSVVITDPLDKDLHLLQSSYEADDSQGNVLLNVDGSEYLLIAEEGGDSNHDWAFCDSGVLTVNIIKITGVLQPGSSGWLVFKTKLGK
ncbi:MAG: SdrD B-like domain-containing protein, partial [Kosmotogaceae bacterium]